MPNTKMQWIAFITGGLLGCVHLCLFFLTDYGWSAVVLDLLTSVICERK